MDKETQRKLDLGREAYENREYDKAEFLLREVLAHSDRYADVMNMLGVLSHERGLLDEARGLFERSLAINANYTEAALNLAVTYNDLGLYDQARETYTQVTQIANGAARRIEPYARGKLANMHANLGRAYAELLMFDKAIQQYNEALALAPEFVDIRTRLGQLLKDMGRFDQASAQLNVVKEQQPSYIPARVSLGVARLATGDKQGARREWQEALAIAPGDKTVTMYLRMVDQLMAQDEAGAAGMPLEVDSHAPEAVASGELDFSFDGESSSVSVASEAETSPSASTPKAD